jgi:hypothetical protein
MALNIPESVRPSKNESQTENMEPGWFLEVKNVIICLDIKNSRKSVSASE